MFLHVSAQEQSPYTENPLSTSISVYAYVPEKLPPFYPIYYIPPNSPLVNGVPVSVEAGADTILFKGLSYPNSIITLLKNGVIVSEVPASPNGTFEIRLRNLNPGTFTFGIFAKDELGLVSKLETFTVYIATGITTVVGGIVIAPTITTNNTEVIWGDPMSILGSSVPNATVNILVNSETKLLKKVTAGSSGTWQYTLDTHELEIGEHTTAARSIINEGISSLSDSIGFTVGSRNVTRQGVTNTLGAKVKCDLNNDGRVNLSDFSIMAYWYKRDGFPARVDLNNDATISLTDFSILAYCWTG